MDVYNFSETNSEFLGVSKAFEDPKNKGNFLMPRNSTEIAPPNTNKNQVAQFNGGEWFIVPDFRSWKGYDENGEPVYRN